MDFPPSFFRNSGKMSKCSAATQSGERCPALPRARLPGLERLQSLFSAAEAAAGAGGESWAISHREMLLTPTEVFTGGA